MKDELEVVQIRPQESGLRRRESRLIVVTLDWNDRNTVVGRIVVVGVLGTCPGHVVSGTECLTVGVTTFAIRRNDVPHKVTVGEVFLEIRRTLPPHQQRHLIEGGNDAVGVVESRGPSSRLVSPDALRGWIDIVNRGETRWCQAVSCQRIENRPRIVAGILVRYAGPSAKVPLLQVHETGKALLILKVRQVLELMEPGFL